MTIANSETAIGNRSRPIAILYHGAAGRPAFFSESRRFSDEIIYVPGRGPKKIKDLSCKDMKKAWHSAAMRRRVRQQVAREQEQEACQPS